MTPLNSMFPEISDHVGGEKTQDKEEEKKPRKEQISTPSSETMAGQGVTYCRYGSKQAKQSTVENHFTSILQLIGQCHGDQGDSRDEVADVEEEEKSEE